MSREVVSWREGRVYVWTGTATASAVLYFHNSINMTFVKGVDSQPRLDGSYCNTVTGQRSDVNTQQYYAGDTTLMRMFDSATAVHLKVTQGSYWGTASAVLWSGFIDSVSLNASENGLYQFSMVYHANGWNFYG
jgi:hypothetical protein